MLVEISDPSAMASIRAHLQRNGCPTEPRSEDTFEVRTRWSPGAAPSEADARATVVAHLREWCADHRGVKANILA
ncbi:MAG TPA: hypothetical protein VFR63_10045 [Gaiellaceae bacterium]|nr:hypothetical protein [Gaiellaceae bacterium]